MDENIKRRISREPRYGVALYRILGDCLEPIAFSDLDARICAYPEMQAKLHEPSILVSWLVDAGALDTLPEGSGKTDTLQPAPADMGITEEFDAANHDPSEIILVVTEAGKRVWVERKESGQVTQLLEGAGPSKRAYERVLELCRTPQPKRFLEQTLAEEGLLDLEQRQVSCYLDKLEKAGGLVWNKGWNTTQLGLAELG